MDSYQSIMMAESATREHQERAQRAADRWYLTGQGTRQPTLRETLADVLIALAHRLAPQHAALNVQHR